MTSPRQAPFYDGRRYDVAESVGYQLVQLALQLRREVEFRMASHGLTDAQWRPLWLLKNGLTGNAIELAREMHVDAGAVTRLLDRLEAKGLVDRLRSGQDRRVVHLRLTAAGEAAVAEVPQVLAALNNDLLRGFDEVDWSTLRGLLARLATNSAAMQSARELA
jgi:DNA-binding MarR family transcriptional regulator